MSSTSGGQIHENGEMEHLTEMSVTVIGSGGARSNAVMADSKGTNITSTNLATFRQQQQQQPGVQKEGGRNSPRRNLSLTNNNANANSSVMMKKPQQTQHIISMLPQPSTAATTRLFFIPLNIWE